jgi:antitoxin HicB
MRFVYAAALVQESDEVVVSFRDLPECLTSGADESDALEEAQDALEEAIAGRIDDDEPIPVPSDPQPGEYLVVVPADMAAKAALTLAFRESGLTRIAFAELLRRDEKTVRRMLDPRHGTSASRINKALRRLGREIVVEVV